MEQVETTLGPLPMDSLEVTRGVDSNEHCSVAWTEYRHEGQLVRRDAHITVTGVAAGIAQALFG